MNTIQKFALLAVAGVALCELTGCADMSRQNRDTATGAGVGGVAGAILTGGSAAGTVGGAAGKQK